MLGMVNEWGWQGLGAQSTQGQIGGPPNMQWQRRQQRMSGSNREATIRRGESEQQYSLPRCARIGSSRAAAGGIERCEESKRKQKRLAFHGEFGCLSSQLAPASGQQYMG